MMYMVLSAVSRTYDKPLLPCLAGLILVHDLTNRKSHGNLSRWLTEFHQSSCRDGSKGASGTEIRGLVGRR